MMMMMILVASRRVIASQEVICMVGYVMDKYCIDRGVLLDDPSSDTLLYPDRHTAQYDRPTRVANDIDDVGRLE